MTPPPRWASRTTDSGARIRWQISAPAALLARATLPEVDYVDAVRATTPCATYRSPQQWVVDFHAGAPSWVRKLAGASDDVAGLVVTSGEDWVLLEDADTLMSTQFVCRTSEDAVELAFVIRYRHPAARFIWPVMSRLHRRVAVHAMHKIVEAAEVSLITSP